MTNDFPEDTFTETDVLSCLEQAGLKYKNGHRYILAQCPTHDDDNPSVQIYKDDWFVNCHAGCGRYHITKAFPSLRKNSSYANQGLTQSSNNDKVDTWLDIEQNASSKGAMQKQQSHYIKAVHHTAKSIANIIIQSKQVKELEKKQAIEDLIRGMLISEYQEKKKWSPNIDTSWKKRLVGNLKVLSLSTTLMELEMIIDQKILNSGLEELDMDNEHQKSYAQTAAPHTTKKHKNFDQMEYWKSLPIIPRTHEFKTIPLETLDFMGWRWLEEKNSYYIPYFNMSETQIPFSQMRHLSGERRFTFLKDARPIIYGLQNLDPSNSPLFLVEGSSDCAVLDYCAVPWIGTPSSSQKELIHGLGKYCKENGISIIYAGDNDEAGDKVREALDDVVSYRVHQPPKKYKDWGDFLVAEGHDVVYKYLWDFIEPPKIEFPEKELTAVEKVQKIFPGAVELQIAGQEENSKELSTDVQQPLF